MTLADALKILGFDKMPTMVELRIRYRELSKKYHPDHGGNDEQMKNLNVAREFILSKIEKSANFSENILEYVSSKREELSTKFKISQDVLYVMFGFFYIDMESIIRKYKEKMNCTFRNLKDVDDLYSKVIDNFNREMEEKLMPICLLYGVNFDEIKQKFDENVDLCQLFRHNFSRFYYF